MARRKEIRRLFETLPPSKTTTERQDEELHDCDHKGCQNVVFVGDRRYSDGPVYCALHRDPVAPG